MTKAPLILATLNESGGVVSFSPAGDPVPGNLTQDVVICLTTDSDGTLVPVTFGADGPKGDKGDKGDPGDDGLLSSPVVIEPGIDGEIDVNSILTALLANGLITIDTTTSAAELAKIVDAGLETVPFGTEDTLAGVTAAILVLAAALIDDVNYDVTAVDGATYADGVWTGKLAVYCTLTPLNAVVDAENRELTITIATE